MSQAEPVSITTSDIELTRRGKRAAAQEAARRKAIVGKRAIYKSASAEVERLLAVLDRLDGDADLEPTGDDEPSLGFTRPGAGQLWGVDGHANVDAELDTSDDEPDADREPSLAAPENQPGMC